MSENPFTNISPSGNTPLGFNEDSFRKKSASSANINAISEGTNFAMEGKEKGNTPKHSNGGLRKSTSHNNVSCISPTSSISSPTANNPNSTLWSHVGNHRTSIPPEATFDEGNDQIKKDLIRMIIQYLQREGFTMSSATIQDEANIKLVEKLQEKEVLRRISKGIDEGDWDLVAKMINKTLKKFHSQQGFLYAVCKQEYFELIDRQEYQKAFTFLTTHLKPLEKISTMTNKNEFKDLCYLLTCKSVGEVEAFRDWEGVVKSREKLAEQLRSTFELDEVSPDDHVEIPDNRLVNLLHQAVAYQMEFSRYHPKTIPKVSTLLRNFECEILPNCVKSTYVGHSQNVKYVTFVGHEGEYLASGSSDNKIKVWPVELPLLRAKSSNIETSGDICSVSRDLRGHTSRIWYMCSNNGGDMLYSASGDGTVKIWSLKNALTDLISSSDGSHSISSAKPHGISNSALTPSNDCVSTLQGHSGDIYSVNIHPNESHLVTGGYDQTVRLYDIQTGAVTKTFRGHMAAVCDAQFNRHANLIVSGSKDGTIRLWDILSGLCVHTLRQTLGEVTSVSLASNGFMLLTGSRNNSNRLWDMRMLNAPRAVLNYRSNGHKEQRPIQRFKGHQNTAKNVVRASFGPREAFVLGGSEDGAVYIWDVATGRLLEKLAGHTGVTYNAKWHEKQALMASSSHDGTVKTWWWHDLKR